MSIIKRYWLTPPEIFQELQNEFAFDFAPGPYPRPDGCDSLELDWGAVNYVNPPFRRHDGVNGQGPTALVRKAIEEQQQGKTSVLTVPVQSYVNLLLEAGAELRSGGRVRWLEIDTKEPSPSPSPIVIAVLRGK